MATYQESFDNLLKKTPLEVVNYLIKNLSVKIPDAVVTPDDMKMASESMLKLSGYYSYLMTLKSYTKIKVREAAREAKKTKNKEEHEDMVDRMEAINNYTEAIKQTYAAVSRAVTIYIENNNELRMGKGTP